MPTTVIYIASMLLFVAVSSLCCVFYTLFRLASTVVFIWASVIVYHKDKSSILKWGFVLGAILFNPIIPLHLKREIWAPLDVVVALGLLMNKMKIS